MYGIASSGVGDEQIVTCSLTWHFGRRGVGGLEDSGRDLGKIAFFNLSILQTANLQSSLSGAIMLTWFWLRSLRDIDWKGKSFWVGWYTSMWGSLSEKRHITIAPTPRKTRQRLFAPPKTCQRHSGQRGYNKGFISYDQRQYHNSKEEAVDNNIECLILIMIMNMSMSENIL